MSVTQNTAVKAAARAEAKLEQVWQESMWWKDNA